MSFLYFTEKSAGGKCSFLLEVECVTEASLAEMCAQPTLSLVVVCVLLTLGLPPEVGFSCRVWIFSMLRRHCMGKYSHRMFLECG